MFGDKLEHECHEWHEAFYLRLELLSPNRFDKLVQFVFGDKLEHECHEWHEDPIFA